MKINVIGDVHGRGNWRQLVDDDAVNVFVGDYFDPYLSNLDKTMVDNFKAIVQYAREHNTDNCLRVVLLYGNHDLHYIYPQYGGMTSRYDRRRAETLHQLFEEARDAFYGIAFVPDDRHIITHAGVTREWFDEYVEVVSAERLTTSAVGSIINELWWNSEDGSEFTFSPTDIFDIYGDSPTQSPIWVRPNTLIRHNLFKDSDVIQIVGHTQVPCITDTSDTYKIVLVDCLGTVAESYKYNI